MFLSATASETVTKHFLEPPRNERYWGPAQIVTDASLWKEPGRRLRNVGCSINARAPLSLKDCLLFQGAGASTNDEVPYDVPSDCSPIEFDSIERATQVG